MASWLELDHIEVTGRGDLGPRLAELGDVDDGPPVGRVDATQARCYVPAMIKVQVTYPSGEGSTFDHDYYANSHVPLAVKAWSPLRTEIDKGVSGPDVASVSFYFDSMDAFQGALGKPATG